MTAHSPDYQAQFAPKGREYHKLTRIFLEVPAVGGHDPREYRFELVQAFNEDGSSHFTALVWYRVVPENADSIRIPWHQYGAVKSDITEMQAVDALRTEWASVVALQRQQDPRWEAPANPFVWPVTHTRGNPDPMLADPWMQFADGSRSWEKTGVPPEIDDIKCNGSWNPGVWPYHRACVKRGPKGHGLSHRDKNGHEWGGEWENPYA